MTPQYQQNPYQQPSFDPSGGTSGPGPLGLDPKMAAMLCYLPVCAVNLIMSIICLVTGGDNRFVKFHAKQSLFLTVGFIVLTIVIQILQVVLSLLGDIGKILVLVVSLLFFAVLLGFIGINVFLMIKAYGGNKTKLPVIGGFAE